MEETKFRNSIKKITSYKNSGIRSIESKKCGQTKQPVKIHIIQRQGRMNAQNADREIKAHKVQV